MPIDRLAELIERLEPIAKIGGFLKWLVVCVALGTAWLVTLQLQVASNNTAIAEIHADRKERIKASEEWHRQKDKEDATRDGTLKAVVDLQKSEQEQLNALFRPAPRP